MPNMGEIAAYTIPGILQGIGQGIIRKKLLTEQKKAGKENIEKSNIDRHVQYIMNKMEDPKTPEDMKTLYADQYYELTGQRIYPEHIFKIPPKEKEMFVPPYQRRTPEGYEWVPPAMAPVPKESPIVPSADPVTEYFNQLVMQKPEIFQKQRTEIEKQNLFKAQQEATRALGVKRSRY